MFWCGSQLFSYFFFDSFLMSNIPANKRIFSLFTDLLIFQGHTCITLIHIHFLEKVLNYTCIYKILISLINFWDEDLSLWYTDLFKLISSSWLISVILSSRLLQISFNPLGISNQHFYSIEWDRLFSFGDISQLIVPC